IGVAVSIGNGKKSIRCLGGNFVRGNLKIESSCQSSPEIEKFESIRRDEIIEGAGHISKSRPACIIDRDIPKSLHGSGLSGDRRRGKGNVEGKDISLQCVGKSGKVSF